MRSFGAHAKHHHQLMAFSGWVPVATVPKAKLDLALASRLPEQIDIFQIRDRQVYWASDDWDSGPQWDPLKWKSLLAPNGSATQASTLSAVSTSLRDLQVMARGDGNDYSIRTYNPDDQTWKPWELVPGGFFTNSPAAFASQVPGRFEMFVLGNDLSYHYRTHVDGQWHPFVQLGSGIFRYPPGAASPSPTRADVIGVGGDYAIWHKSITEGQGWTEWERLGGQTEAPAVLVSHAPWRLAVFILGMDKNIWYKLYNGAWSKWIRIDCVAYSQPYAISTTENTIDLFHLGTEKRIYRGRLTI